EDILMLADHFQRLYSRKYKKTIKGLSREAGSKLMKYPWPGNVRELQHVLERAVILSESPLLRPNDFPLYASSCDRKREEDPDLNLEQTERKTIERALRQSNGNMSYAAELLGITRFSLYRKIEKFGL
ncbi:helix-turn-helix domain-containing protein, partial [Parabacteroides sp.]